MLNLDADAVGAAPLALQLVPAEHALDAWAVSAVMTVAAAMLLNTAGADVRRWLRNT